MLLASVSPWLLFLPLSAVPPLAADRVAKRITKRSEDAAATSRWLAGPIFGLSTDAGAAGELRAYGLTEHLMAEHRQAVLDVDRRSAREARRVLAVQATGWLLYAALLTGAIAFVVVRATDGALSLGTVLMSVSIIRRSRNQLASAAQGSGALVNTLATADRFFWLQDHAAQEAAQDGTQSPPQQLREGIALRGIRFAYPGTEHVVLDGVDLTLAAGSTVAVVPENGSGKTTLVKLLLGMYRPSDGVVLVDGTPLDALASTRWRSRTSAAFQDFARFQMPAVEGIGLADLPRHTDEPLARAALERAGAAELPGQLPDGLATNVGTTFTGGHGLSGGQWQKLALGRAMRRDDPLLLVLDEPTASLDAQAEHALFERCARAAESLRERTGAVTVLVSHRFSTVRTADQIVYLQGGRVVESGSHEELMARGGRYAELFDLQAAGYR